jgi:hypothetical protein
MGVTLRNPIPAVLSLYGTVNEIRIDKKCYAGE